MNEYNVIPANLPEPFLLINTMACESGFVLDKSHTHTFYHVNYIFDGSVDIVSKNRITVAAGQAFILPPGIEHNLYTENGYRQFGVDIALSSHPLSRAAETAAEGKITLSNRFKTDLSFEKISALIKSPTEFNLLKLKNAAEKAVLQAIEHCGKYENEFILKLDAAIDECFDLNGICNKMGYSRTQLERLAVKNVGCSVMEYGARHKLDRVCALLETTSAPLFYIAQQTGFFDAAHLTRFFKKRMGITPGQYRKNGSEIQKQETDIH